MEFQVITTEDEEFIVSYIPDRGIVSMRDDHPNYAQVKDLLNLTPEELEDEDSETIASLFDPAETIRRKFEALTDRVQVANGQIYIDGDVTHNSLADLIVRLMRRNEDFMPFVLFYDNILQNPEVHSQEMAFEWIQAAGDGMSITPDGWVVGFKGATRRSDDTGYESWYTGSDTVVVNGEEHTGKIPYDVGSVVEMARSQVTFDPGESCSHGLHVGTRSYAKGFASRGAVLEVLVNPRDIVSVPEGEHEKMRVCRFYINGEEDPNEEYGPLRQAFVPDDSSEDEEIEPDYGEEDFDEDWTEEEQLEPEEEDLFAGANPPRNPTQAEWDGMKDRVRVRKQNFQKYVTTTGGWTLQAGLDGTDRTHYLVG